MNISSGIFWSDGGCGGENEDSLSFQQVRSRDGRTVLAVVCDGIGGLQEGCTASAGAAEQMTRWFYTEYRLLLQEKANKEMILLALQRQIFRIQENFQSYQKQKNICMGTTMTLLLLRRRRYFLVHIGDSRAYRITRRLSFRRGGAVRIRRMAEDDATESGSLTKCLGAGGLDRAYYDTGRFWKRTGFLLCTDGFWRGIREEEAGRILNPRGSLNGEELTRKLEMMAERMEGRVKDNRAAVCIVAGGRSGWKNIKYWNR